MRTIPVAFGIRAAATAVTLPSARLEWAKFPADAYADAATQDSVSPAHRSSTSSRQAPRLAIRDAGARKERKEMTHALAELQVQITAAQERILAAIEADDPYEVARHRARLGRPRRHGCPPRH
jgi:hypothetical protein